MPRKADAGETRIEGWVAVNLSGLPYRSGDEEGTLMEAQRAEAVEETRLKLDLLKWIEEYAPETMKAWRESYATQTRIRERLEGR